MLFARKFPVRRIENAPRRKRSQPDCETWGERAEFALVIHFGSGGPAKDKMGRAIANIFFLHLFHTIMHLHVRAREVIPPESAARVSPQGYKQGSQ